jgi:hypothetical protein
MIENNPPGQMPYVLRWKMKEAGFLILTPMNDGSYIYKWLPAITDKEDKKMLPFNPDERKSR